MFFMVFSFFVVSLIFYLRRFSLSVDTHLETSLLVFTVNSIHHFENKIKPVCLLCKHFGVLHNLILLCMFTMPHFAVFVISFFCFVFPAFMLSYKKRKPQALQRLGFPERKRRNICS